MNQSSKFQAYNKLMIAALMILTAQQTTPFVHEPSASYTKYVINGFTVMVSSAAKQHPETTDPALKLIEQATSQITKFIPEKALSVIQKAKIWMEQMNPDFPSMCYHGGGGWLRENKYNPDKENCIEISNPKNAVAWTKLNQPYQLFHEFAHAYHDLKFGFDDDYIKACWKLAVARGVFESVDYKPSGKRKHYGLSNQMEYFAEMSEAYFGENDFYPFNRAQLKEFDPKGFTMIEWSWGVSEPK